MSGMARVYAFAVAVCVVVAALAWAEKMKIPPPTVRSAVEGTYEIRRSGEHVGVEEFVRTTMSNNTVILESVYEVVEAGGEMVLGNNRLEFEEDSGFPRSYYTYRHVQKPDDEFVREVTAEMFANVAVLTERQNEVENRRAVNLPTGCLFIEGNIAHQVSVVLNRYNPTVGGKQGFKAFDPLAGETTDVAVEFMGDSTSTTFGIMEGENPTPGRTLHYRLYSGRYPAVDVYVDMGGVIKEIDVGFRNLTYSLTSLKERNGETEPPR
jgi:hypothetical protein